MSGIYVNGPFAVRPFQLEGVCHASVGHRHNYDHWMLIKRGTVQIDIRESEDGPVVETIMCEASDKPLIEAPRADPDKPRYKFHAFIAKHRFHTVKALEPFTQYECTFLHRDFETGEITETYNGNPEAVA